MTKSESRAEANTAVVAVNAVVVRQVADVEARAPRVVGVARILRRRPVEAAKTERAAIIRTCYS